MKNQSGTSKTNLELDRVVMGGSGGYRRLPGGSDHFLLQTELHHNIYIIIIIIFSIQKVEFVDIFPTVVEAAELGEPIQLCPELSNTTLLCTEV